MIELSDEQFEKIIGEAMDAIPEQYAKHMNNVAITWADDPTPAQREKLKLRCDQSLYGLYEGIPLTKRGIGYNLVLPDKITIFKNPTLRACNDASQVKKEVAHTLWHEIAHHYGLDHARIHALEDKQT